MSTTTSIPTELTAEIDLIVARLGPGISALATGSLIEGFCN